MSTDSKDGFGLNKLARLLDSRSKLAEQSQTELLEPKFPHLCQQIDPSFWIPTLPAHPQDS